MNVKLEQLFLEYDIGEKDRHEILAVYLILPKHKQQNMLSNFESLAKKVKKIEQELIYEQSMLLDSLEENLKNMSR